MGQPPRCADGLRAALGISLQVCVVKAELGHTDVSLRGAGESAETDPQTKTPSDSR